MKSQCPKQPTPPEKGDAFLLPHKEFPLYSEQHNITSDFWGDPLEIATEEEKLRVLMGEKAYEEREKIKPK